MFSPPNIANFLACPHIITLDRAESAGEIKRPYCPDPAADLLRELGLRHETSYLQILKDQEIDAVEIPTEARGPKPLLLTTTKQIIRDAKKVIEHAEHKIKTRAASAKRAAVSRLVDGLKNVTGLTEKVVKQTKRGL